MLSLVASIFELRRGVAMPETVVELYDQATKAMLSRAGEESAIEFGPLLQVPNSLSHHGSSLVRLITPLVPCAVAGHLL